MVFQYQPEIRDTRGLFSHEVANHPPRKIIGPLTYSHSDAVECDPESVEEDHYLSGYLSSSEDVITQDESFQEPVVPEAPVLQCEEKILCDDSATESHDEGRNVTSSQTTKSNPLAAIEQITRKTRVIDGVRSIPSKPTPSLIPSSPKAVLQKKTTFATNEPEHTPSKGKSCIIIALTDEYQPIFHEWADPKEIPKVHLFHFENYTQSPFDVPPVNVPKYFAEKELMRAKRHKKKLEEEEVAANFCEICRQKVKGKEHRQSQRHQLRAASGWEELDELEMQLLRANYDSL